MVVCYAKAAIMVAGYAKRGRAATLGGQAVAKCGS
jgi:hypothetical protein